MMPPRLAVLALTACLASAAPAHGQTPGDPGRPTQVSGAVNVNTKGISTVPALTLGRPAVITDLVVRKGHVSFEPQFRFALDGTPWSFLLWGRYRAVSRDRFRLTVGGHPAYSFRARPTEVDGRAREVLEVRRYFAVEATPTVVVSRHVQAGGYYLYSRGVDPGAPPHTHLVAARLAVADVALPRGFVLQATPQAYYLFTNGKDGTYVSATASVGRRGVPWSISAILNRPIRSDVTGGQAFLWNVGVTYAFRVP